MTYTAYIFPNPVSLETYTFTAVAVDDAGNVSVSSNEDSAAVLPCALPPGMPNPLSSPPILTALSSSAIRLDWVDSQSNSILEYRVYRDGASSYIGRTFNKTFTDFQLVPGSTHCYTVTRVDFDGDESAQSPPVCNATTSDVPPAPKNVTAAASGAGQVAISCVFRSIPTPHSGVIRPLIPF